MCHHKIGAPPYRFPYDLVGEIECEEDRPDLPGGISYLDAYIVAFPCQGFRGPLFQKTINIAKNHQYAYAGKKMSRRLSGHVVKNFV